MATLVSNLAQASSSSGYTDNITGVPKMYYSTLETSAAPTTKYKLYRWSPIPVGLGDATNGGLFQTQNQIFSKKILVTEVRIYAQPWVANNSFTVDLIGSNDAAISGGSYTFTTGSTLTAGSDYAWYNPNMVPVNSLALRITNLGTANHVINKVEIDYTQAGK